MLRLATPAITSTRRRLSELGKEEQRSRALLLPEQGKFFLFFADETSAQPGRRPRPSQAAPLASLVPLLACGCGVVVVM